MSETSEADLGALHLGCCSSPRSASGHCTEPISSLAPKIWEVLPNERKDSETLQIFKAKKKKWIPVNVPVNYARSIYP